MNESTQLLTRPDKWLKNLSSGRIKLVRSYAVRDDLNVIRNDVLRSFGAWDAHRGASRSKVMNHQGMLFNVVLRLMRRHSAYEYYQGFHEICLVVLEATLWNSRKALEVLEPLAQLRFCHILTEGFASVIPSSLNIIAVILKADGSQVMRDDTPNQPCDVMGRLHICIPWILTWFAHSFDRMDDIFLIYDFLIPQPPWTSLYMCAAGVTLLEQSGIDVSLASHTDIARFGVSTILSEAARLLRVAPAKTVLLHDSELQTLLLKNYTVNIQEQHALNGRAHKLFWAFVVLLMSVSVLLLLSLLKRAFNIIVSEEL